MKTKERNSSTWLATVKGQIDEKISFGKKTVFDAFVSIYDYCNEKRTSSNSTWVQSDKSVSK